VKVGIGEILQTGERFEVFFDIGEARIGGNRSEVPWNVGGGICSAIDGFFRDECRGGGGSMKYLCELQTHS
jgi:hypothetical protein